MSESQKQLQGSVRKVAAEKFETIADELDRKQQFPMDNFKVMAGMGLTGLGIPAQYGGSGGGKMEEAIAIEELSRACASTGGILSAHLTLCTDPVYYFGNEQQRHKYLPALTKGDAVGAFAITESEAGSDISMIKSTAIKEGNHYILNGSKVFITNGNVAGVYVVFANVPSLGKRGMTAFIIENGMHGFSRGKVYDKVGMRASTQCELVFIDCHVPVENRLGEEGQGMKICLSTLDRGRIGIASQALGITRAVLEKSADHAKKRVQFGGPIGQQEAIAWKLADMAMELDAARLLTYRAAFLCDSSQPFTPEAAMAKLAGSELAMRASVDGIQIFGGYGYMMDSAMQRHFRDSKLTCIYEGTSEVQRMVISRNVLR